MLLNCFTFFTFGDMWHCLALENKSGFQYLWLIVHPCCNIFSLISLQMCIGCFIFASLMKLSHLLLMKFVVSVFMWWTARRYGTVTHTLCLIMLCLITASLFWLKWGAELNTLTIPWNVSDENTFCQFDNQRLMIGWELCLQKQWWPQITELKIYLLNTSSKMRTLKSSYM